MKTVFLISLAAAAFAVKSTLFPSSDISTETQVFDMPPAVAVSALDTSQTDSASIGQS